MCFGILIGTTGSHLSLLTVIRVLTALLEGKGCQNLESGVSFGPDT